MLVILSLMLALAAATLAAIHPAGKLTLATAGHQQALAQAVRQMGLERQTYAGQLQQAFAAQALKIKLEKQMAEQARPEILVPLFLQNIDQLPVAPTSLQKQTGTASSSGSISGRVTVNGKVPDPSQSIHLIAFDLQGYFAGLDSVKGSAGEFSILNLKAGEYYVMTSSHYYVDELYDNVAAPLDNRETWRMARTVVVPEGAAVMDVNFDLQTGVRISGRLYRENGTTPVQSEDVNFVFTTASTPKPIFTQSCYTIDGSYSLTAPLTGAVKISASINGYLPTWTKNSTQWEAGNLVTLPAYGSSIGGIHFTLQKNPEVANRGVVQGSIRFNDQLTPPFLSAVYAFDLADTTLANLTLALLGSYSFDALPPGRYLFYANDILSSFTGGTNHLGQFYQNARTPDQATVVTVAAGDTLSTINFLLEKGGVISGRVTNEQNAPLDSVLVMAVDAGLAAADGDPFLSHVAVYLCQADDQGRYRLEGLPDGEYVVRTLSDSLLDVEQLGLTLRFKKHGGKYVDEYYRDVQNLFAFRDAIRVPVRVPEETANIDFVLDSARYITGKVSDAVTGAPVTNILLFAFSDTSGYPYLSPGMFLKKQVAADGAYRLGPLPSGRFKLLAVAGGLEFKTDYLSEFYDGSRSFYTAAVVEVGQTDRGGVDFTLDHGAVIQGFVKYSGTGGTVTTGADTLDGFPVMVFDAGSGELASMDFVQFSGGYRVDHLMPGSYKILALPALAPFAATYYGGGDTFDDPASQTVTVDYGQVLDCPIVLETAAASISGEIKSSETGNGIPQVMMIAYDPTGHPSGLAMTDMNLINGWVDPDPKGSYAIQGLRPGVYYLRSCGLAAAMGLSDQLLGLVNMISADIDPLALIGNIDQLSSLFSISFTVYQDLWYQAVPTQIGVDLNALLFNLAAYGIPNEMDNALLPIYLPLPMAEKIPVGAIPIVLTGGETAAGRNFALQSGGIGDIFVDVPEKESASPEQFSLSANYPNPFNPETQWQLSLPAAANVSAAVYNVAGQLVKTVAEGWFAAGQHQLRWDATDNRGAAVPAGVYLLQLTAGDVQKTLKLTLLK